MSYLIVSIFGAIPIISGSLRQCVVIYTGLVALVHLPVLLVAGVVTRRRDHGSALSF